MKDPVPIASEEELHQVIAEAANPVVKDEMPADKMPALRGRCRTRLRGGHQLIY